MISTSSWVSRSSTTSDACVPVTRNRGPGACWLQLPHRCDTAPPVCRRATKTSSSSPSPGSAARRAPIDRAEQHERLVDQVSPEVEQRAASGRAGPVGRGRTSRTATRTGVRRPGCRRRRGRGPSGSRSPSAGSGRGSASPQPLRPAPRSAARRPAPGRTACRRRPTDRGRSRRQSGPSACRPAWRWPPPRPRPRPGPPATRTWRRPGARRR